MTTGNITPTYPNLGENEPPTPISLFVNRLNPQIIGNVVDLIIDHPPKDHSTDIFLAGYKASKTGAF